MVDPVSGVSVAHQFIRYRPDPGEPAVDVTASPRQSAYLVTAQEQRNETRLRNRAILRGEEVLYSHRTFTQGYQNGKAVYNGGLTTVVSRKRQTNPLIEAAAQNRENNKVQATPDAQETAQPSSIKDLLTEATEKDDQDIERDRQELNVQQGHIENRKERAAVDLKQAAEDGDLIQAQFAKQKMNELDRRENAIEREDNKMALEQFQSRLKDAQKLMQDAIQENAGAASKVLGVLYGGQQQTAPSTGKRLDLLI